jgi:uncharacterized protein (TIGR02996 family)
MEEPEDFKNLMTNTRDALYRAICAEPDEDTPRLAFADLVDEEGDHHRAGFIRAQVALARVPRHDPLAVTIRHANPGAVHDHAMAHTLPEEKDLPVGYGWRAFEFRRGFPWKIGMHTAAAFDAAGAIFELAPIGALDVGPRGRPDVDAVAAWPHLARLQRLEFSSAHFGANEAERLGNSPHATALTELGFEFDGITADGLEALGRTPLFARLSALELRSNAMPPELLADALGAVRRPGALKRLSLAANRLTGRGAENLFSLPVMRGLEHLDLADNQFLGPSGAKALAESGILGSVRILDLEDTHPGVEGIRALVETGALVGVRCLYLPECGLGPVAVQALAQSDVLRALRVLNLSGNRVRDKGAAAIAGSSALAGLLELDLADAELTDVGARALVGSPYLDGLLRLNLAATSRDRQAIGPAARWALTERFGPRVSF